MSKNKETQSSIISSHRSHNIKFLNEKIPNLLEDISKNKNKDYILQKINEIYEKWLKPISEKYKSQQSSEDLKKLFLTKIEIEINNNKNFQKSNLYEEAIVLFKEHSQKKEIEFSKGKITPKSSAQTHDNNATNKISETEKIVQDFKESIAIIEDNTDKITKEFADIKAKTLEKTKKLFADFTSKEKLEAQEAISKLLTEEEEEEYTKTPNEIKNSLLKHQENFLKISEDIKSNPVLTPLKKEKAQFKLIQKARAFIKTTKEKIKSISLPNKKEILSRTEKTLLQTLKFLSSPVTKKIITITTAVATGSIPAIIFGVSISAIDSIVDTLKVFLTRKYKKECSLLVKHRNAKSKQDHLQVYYPEIYDALHSKIEKFSVPIGKEYIDQNSLKYQRYKTKSNINNLSMKTSLFNNGLNLLEDSIELLSNFSIKNIISFVKSVGGIFKSKNTNKKAFLLNDKMK